MKTNPFDEARVIARGDCLALGDDPMHWVVRQAVDSLKRDGKPVSKEGVLRVIGHLEDVMLPPPEPVHGQLYGTDTVVTGYPDDDELEAM